MGWTQHIFHACAHKIKPTIQSSCLHTKRVHDGLRMHTYMSGLMHTPNLDCVQIRAYSNSINIAIFDRINNCDTAIAFFMGIFHD